MAHVIAQHCDTGGRFSNCRNTALLPFSITSPRRFAWACLNETPLRSSPGTWGGVAESSEMAERQAHERDHKPVKAVDRLERARFGGIGVTLSAVLLLRGASIDFSVRWLSRRARMLHVPCAAAKAKRGASAAQYLLFKSAAPREPLGFVGSAAGRRAGPLVQNSAAATRANRDRANR